MRSFRNLRTSCLVVLPFFNWLLLPSWSKLAQSAVFVFSSLEERRQHEAQPAALYSIWCQLCRQRSAVPLAGSLSCDITRLQGWLGDVVLKWALVNPAVVQREWNWKERWSVQSATATVIETVAFLFLLSIRSSPQNQHLNDLPLWSQCYNRIGHIVDV